MRGAELDGQLSDVDGPEQIADESGAEGDAEDEA
jgi:hypothetical protein